MINIENIGYLNLDLLDQTLIIRKRYIFHCKLASNYLKDQLLLNLLTFSH